MSRPLAMLVLLLATMFWGFGFVAQKSAMTSVGPLTFIAARYLLGGLAVLPLALREHARRKTRLTHRHWAVIGFLAVNFFLGSYLQQTGLLTTSVTNGGFLTGLYVFFVPIVLLVMFRTRPHPVVWLCSPLALGGLYLLTGAQLTAFGSGDSLVIASSFFWAMHVLIIGYAARQTGLPILVSCATFLMAGAFSLLLAGGFEVVTLADLSHGWVEIAYAGLVSTAIAFTLQAVGQLHVPPANAAIILSAESLFAAFGGWLLLGERLPPQGYLGAAMILAAIVAVETIPALARRRAPIEIVRP